MIGVQVEKRRVEPFDMDLWNGNTGYIRMIAPMAAGGKGENDQEGKKAIYVHQMLNSFYNV